MADGHGRTRTSPRRTRAAKGTMPGDSPTMPDAGGDGAANGPTDGPSEDAIRRLAYERFLARGGTPGYEVEDWLAAERELRVDSPERR